MTHPSFSIAQLIPSHRLAGRFQAPYSRPSLGSSLAIAGSATDTDTLIFSLEDAIRLLILNYDTEIITEGEHHELCRILIIANFNACSLLPSKFLRVQIDDAFRAAIGLASFWAQQEYERQIISRCKRSSWLNFLRVFGHDLSNYMARNLLKQRDARRMLPDLSLPTMIRCH